MTKITLSQNGEKKDITVKVAVGTVVGVAGLAGAGYLLYKAGIRHGNSKGFAEGFFKATEIIHDAIVDCTDTVKLTGSGKIVGLGQYLETTGDGIVSRLGDLADNEAIALMFEGVNA